MSTDDELRAACLRNYDEMTHEQLRHALDRAEKLYVALSTSQFVARVDQLAEVHTRQVPTKTSTRWLQEARAAMLSAQDDARTIFFAVVTGEVES